MPQSKETAKELSPLIDSIASIKKSALRFFSGTALSRISGMLRDIILAYIFGTHPSLAALFVAFRLSSICRRLFGEGAMQSALIPYFEAIRKENVQKAFRFFQDLSGCMGLLLTGFILVSMIGLQCSHLFISWSEGNAQIVNLTTILMPSLFFICLFGLNISLLQCQKQYFVVGIAPACFNIAIIIGALLFRGGNPTAVMPYVAISLIVGCFLQWFVSFVPALKIARPSLGEHFLKGVQPFSKSIKEFGRPLILGMLGAGATQINNAIDALFARCADPEGPAQLWYALRLQQLPLALFGIALSGALLPPLSRTIQAGNIEEYKRFLEFGLRRVIAILLPATAALLVLGLPLINLVYGHGDFLTDTVFITTGCLQGYALALVPTGFVIVLAPAFFARKDYSTPAIGAFIALFVNCALNSFMVFSLQWKSISVALATAACAWCNALYLWYRLEHNFGRVLSQEGQREIIKICFISLFAGSVVWIIQNSMGVPSSLFNFFTAASIPSRFWEQILALAVPTTLFGLLALLAAWILRAEDITSLVRYKKK